MANPFKTYALSAYLILKGCFKLRFLVLLMFAAGYYYLIYVISAISTTIIAMVKTGYVAVANETTNISQCPVTGKSVNGSSDDVSAGTFMWSPKMQTILLNVGNFGLALSQVPFGRLGERVNAKNLISVIGLSASAYAVVVPIVAQWSIEALVVLQFCVGAVAGGIYPVAMSLINKWIPANELYTMLAMSNGFVNLITIPWPLLTTYLMQYGFAGGWPSVFYVNGAICFAWVVLWHVCVTADPEEHPWISIEELEMIKKTRLIRLSRDNRNVPWKHLLTSIPVWAICAQSFSISWPQILLIVESATYMSFPLNFTISEVGIVITIIAASNFASYTVSAIFEMVFQKCSFFSVTCMRKLYVFIGGIIMAICMAAIPLIACNKFMFAMLYVLAMFFSNIALNAGGTSAMEVAPAYLGTVSGLWNFFGSIPGLLIATTVATITGNAVNLHTWGIVFYLSSGITVVGTMFFMFCGTSEPQPWASKSENECQSENEGPRLEPPIPEYPKGLIESQVHI